MSSANKIVCLCLALLCVVSGQNCGERTQPCCSNAPTQVTSTTPQPQIIEIIKVKDPERARDNTQYPDARDYIYNRPRVMPIVIEPQIARYPEMPRPVQGRYPSMPMYHAAPPFLPEYNDMIPVFARRRTVKELSE
ncbi:uncharacterized protein [Battus philenor]|uniref:uncharacterized protein n=1 Tax=Battus philenor TaxID=42288 RepID=UPI0035D0D7B4